MRSLGLAEEVAKEVRIGANYHSLSSKDTQINSQHNRSADGGSSEASHIKPASHYLILHLHRPTTRLCYKSYPLYYPIR